MPFFVIAESEGMVEHVVAVDDRDEAHRIFANAQRLDDEIVGVGGIEPMRFTLIETPTAGEQGLYEVIAVAALPREDS